MISKDEVLQNLEHMLDETMNSPAYNFFKNIYETKCINCEKKCDDCETKDVKRMYNCSIILKQTLALRKSFSPEEQASVALKLKQLFEISTSDFDHKRMIDINAMTEKLMNGEQI